MDLCQQSYERFVLGTTDDHAHSLYGRVEASKLMMRTAFYSRNKRCNANTQKHFKGEIKINKNCQTENKKYCVFQLTGARYIRQESYGPLPTII
jgi:hypothetical protein